MRKLIHRRILISMLFIGLTMMGLFSYRYLSTELYPNIEMGTLNVTISSQSESDPEYMESKAVEPIEGAIGTLEGIEEIETQISERNARITVSYQPNTNLKYAYLKLEEKIKETAQSLPDEFSVSVSKSGSGMVSAMFMELLVIGDEDIDYVRNITDNDIASALQNVDGIADVMVIGGREKSIEIVLDDEKCDALHLTNSQIASKISANMADKSFVGSVFDQNRRFFVNVTAEYLSLNDIANITITDGPILLKDIAEISFGVKEEESYSRVNGKECVSCILSKSSQEDVIALSERVRKEITQLNEELKTKGVEIIISSDTAETMNSNLDDIQSLGISGALLAIFVLYLFLRNFKIVSFVALSIPISIFAAFYFFFLNDISVNTLTLTGVALAVGMLLDNSIVVMENIFRHRSLGADAETAAAKGTTEVWRSVFAATLTTVTVFLPFLFTDNFLLRIIGQHVGVSIISTLLVSLLVALLLIPMVMYAIMSHKEIHLELSTLSVNSQPVLKYISLLKLCMRHPVTVVISALLLLAGSILLSSTLTVNTLQEIETTSFDLYITSPSGYTLERTDEMIRRYEEALVENPLIKQINSNVYAEEANLTVKLVDNYKETNSLADIKNQVLGVGQSLRIRDISLEATSSSERFQGGSNGGGNALLGGSGDLLKMFGMGSQSEQIIIKGQDYETMENFAELLESQLENLDNISSVSYNSSRRNREARLSFDPLLMENNNVTTQNISASISTFSPENSTSIMYKTNNEEYEITLKNKSYVEAKAQNKSIERTVNDLKHLKVQTSGNGLAEIQQFSTINLARGRGSIHRVNQEKKMEMNYSFISSVNESNQFLDAARAEIDQVVTSLDIPSDISVQIIHEDDDTDEYSFLILAAFLLIYMILASVFESFSAPIVLMFSIPLAAIGSFIILLFTGNSYLTANALMGFIILIGIVVNNSIILIDYTSQLRRNGYSRARALLTAGISRLRPILITAISTIIAMIPLAMGDGEFVAGMGAPFAITVIGGLTTSTLLTLLVIPTLYSGLEDAIKRIRTQSYIMQLIQGVLFLCISCCILLTTDSLWLRLAYFTLAIIGIPAITWALEDTFRKASSQIIAAHEDITIHIHNLVKIYERPSRFVREWHAGKQLLRRLGLMAQYQTWSDLRPLLWLIPLTVFSAYFSLSYLSLSFWIFLFAILTWHLFLYIIHICSQFFKLKSWIYTFVYWLFPFVCLVITFNGWMMFFSIFWYIAITAIYLKNQELTEKKSFRNFFIKLALRVPIFGSKQKPFRALNAISFDIHTGMFGLLGPNGAGKTTLMRIISGILEQSYGKIYINDIDTQLKREELQGLIGYLPQEFGMYENLTAWQFLEYQAILKGLNKRDVREQRICEVLEAVHMTEHKDKRIGGFSGGMKQRIGIAQTLLHLPRILIVDEPTAGLDPRERIRFRNLLVELSRNRIVIFSTHIIEDIASSCNQVAVVNRGSLRYFGTPNEMVHIAEQVTWTFETSPEEFESMAPSLLVVHHISYNNRIHVRCLATSAPTPDAIRTQPILEDSYLWLLHGIKLNNNEPVITQ